MNERLDTVLMVVIGIMGLLLLVWRINRWLMSPGTSILPAVPINELIPDHPAIALIEQEGYEVVGGKVKINLAFDIGERSVHSRLFVDYVASNDHGELYLVKLSRDRMPMDWNGSTVRDRLMPFLLMYPDCAGLLYVDQQEHAVRRISMEWCDEEWNSDI
ncbi:hypothetical protein [Paenibacillus lemnae]|uniref:Uncharacterized protein n=1 Tax=Paenibacillus lemnae TaxID=1330551 RepID=A0A848M9Z1_PAELE|nr:hypothetical protein [Paenibacillus lemnae]NMO96892.1 hypothetical protein [Paenibacillus lemnae]